MDPYSVNRHQLRFSLPPCVRPLYKVLGDKEQMNIQQRVALLPVSQQGQVVPVSNIFTATDEKSVIYSKVDSDLNGKKCS